MADLENSTLDKILQVAEKEFLEKGFKTASLRHIVKEAGVTTGAFYGYFKTKEELFDALVGETYQSILGIYKTTLEDFSCLSPENKLNEMGTKTMNCIRQIIDYAYQHKNAVKLILCSSEGTKYSNLVHKMAEMDVEATHSFADTTKDVNPEIKLTSPMVEHMLTTGMFSTFFELFIHDIPQEEALKYSELLLDFYFAGWQKLMGF